MAASPEDVNRTVASLAAIIVLFLRSWRKEGKLHNCLDERVSCRRTVVQYRTLVHSCNETLMTITSIISVFITFNSQTNRCFSIPYSFREHAEHKRVQWGAAVERVRAGPALHLRLLQTARRRGRCEQGHHAHHCRREDSHRQRSSGDGLEVSRWPWATGGDIYLLVAWSYLSCAFPLHFPHFTFFIFLIVPIDRPMNVLQCCRRCESFWHFRFLTENRFCPGIRFIF